MRLRMRSMRRRLREVRIVADGKLANDDEMRARLEETQGRGKARRMTSRDNEKATRDVSEAFPDEGVMDDGQAQAILNAVLVAQRDGGEVREEGKTAVDG